jgi:hypothetical protein
MDGARQREFRAHAFSACGCQAGVKMGIVKQFLETGGQSMTVTGREEQAGGVDVRAARALRIQA